MADDLFGVMLESQRAQLRALGCHEAAGTDRKGLLHWRLPGGEIVTEAEALAWLERKNTK